MYFGVFLCFEFFFFLSLTSLIGPSPQFKARVARSLGPGSGSGLAICPTNCGLFPELESSRATRVLGSARVSRFGEPKLDPEHMISLLSRV
jgi:hypothetical protein